MPKVNKHILILIAGILWSGVGILLIKISSRWYELLSNSLLATVIVSGVILGIIISYFGFSNLALNNINRINDYPEKVCMWAFQKWQSYILIIFMISLGIFMRKTSFVPRPILIVIYVGIGFALFTASFKYYIFLFNRKKIID